MRITRKEMLEQIKIMLKDEFVAEIEQKGKKIHIIFENGQKFILRVSSRK